MDVLHAVIGNIDAGFYDRLDSKLIQPASDAFKKASSEYPLTTVSSVALFSLAGISC